MKIEIEIPAQNPIDAEVTKKKIEDSAKINADALNLIHEIATTPKFLKGLIKNERLLRNFAKVM